MPCPFNSRQWQRLRFGEDTVSQQKLEFNRHSVPFPGTTTPTNDMRKLHLTDMRPALTQQIQTRRALGLVDAADTDMGMDIDMDTDTGILIARYYPPTHLPSSTSLSYCYYYNFT